MKKKKPITIEKIVKKLRQEIPRKTGCQQCGECCGPVLLTGYEINRIAWYITQNELWPKVAENLLKRATTNDDELRITCPLLDIQKNTTKCLVYPERPIVCRLQGNMKDLRCPMNPKRKPKYRASNWHTRYIDFCKQRGATGLLAKGLIAIINKAAREDAALRNMMEKRRQKVIATKDGLKDAEKTVADSKKEVVNDE